MKIDFKIILAIILGLLISSIAVFLVNQKLHPSSNKNVLSIINSPAPTPGIVNLEIHVTKNQDETYSLSLVPKQNSTLSALSISLVIPKDSITEFLPTNDLLQSGWAFPINKIADTGDTLDISAINTTPEGFAFNQKVVLGTINSNKPLTLEVNKSETKVLDKGANILNYTFIQD